MPIKLADLALSDLVVPEDPEGLPATGVDAGVVMPDLIDHLRVVSRFPVSPIVTGPALPLRVVGGGRCVWAAVQAGWTGALRCVIEGPVPAGISTFAPAAVIDDLDRLVTHTACFAYGLSPSERHLVEERLCDLASRLRQLGIIGLSQFSDLRWPRADLLQLVAPTGRGEDALLGPELYGAFAEISEEGPRLRSWDGRVLL